MIYIVPNMMTVQIAETPLYPLQIAVEAILLWTKGLFFGLAVDGLGTFI